MALVGPSFITGRHRIPLPSPCPKMPAATPVRHPRRPQCSLFCHILAPARKHSSCLHDPWLRSVSDRPTARELSRTPRRVASSLRRPGDAFHSTSTPDVPPSTHTPRGSRQCPQPLPIPAARHLNITAVHFTHTRSFSTISPQYTSVKLSLCAKTARDLRSS